MVSNNYMAPGFNVIMGKICLFHGNPLFEEAFMQKVRAGKDSLPAQLRSYAQEYSQIILISKIGMMAISPLDNIQFLWQDMDRSG